MCVLNGYRPMREKVLDEAFVYKRKQSLTRGDSL
jgi:hypothetical protein